MATKQQSLKSPRASKTGCPTTFEQAFTPGMLAFMSRFASQFWTRRVCLQVSGPSPFYLVSEPQPTTREGGIIALWFSLADRGREAADVAPLRKGLAFTKGLGPAFASIALRYARYLYVP